MVTIQDIFGSFLIAFITAYGFTPLAKQIAASIGLLDYPDRKKSHARPIPLLGGLSIYMAFFIAVLFTTDLNNYIYGILAGGTIIFILGIVDDKFGMMPKMKLSGQILAALIVYKLGFRISTFEDYYVSMFFTVFWIVGITNAFNLLDNLNGLSSGIAGIAAIFFGIMALATSNIYVAILCFALAGACLGFLRHNFPKADIFMGDSGSMLLGFILACLAILVTWKTDKVSLSLSLPFLILGYPIFDTTLVTFLRFIEKRSIFIGGRDHSSHILASLGLKKTRAVLLLYIISFLLGMSTLLVVALPIPIAIMVEGIIIVSMMTFGVYLAAKRLKSAKLKRQNGTNGEE